MGLIGNVALLERVALVHVAGEDAEDAGIPHIEHLKYLNPHVVEPVHKEHHIWSEDEEEEEPAEEIAVHVAVVGPSDEEHASVHSHHCHLQRVELHLIQDIRVVGFEPDLQE